MTTANQQRICNCGCSMTVEPSDQWTMLSELPIEIILTTSARATHQRLCLLPPLTLVWARANKQEKNQHPDKKVQVGWTEHTLRNPTSNVLWHTVMWNPQEESGQGHIRNSWRRTVDNEASKATLGGKVRSYPKTEQDGGRFPWTCAPQGAEWNKLRQQYWWFQLLAILFSCCLSVANCLRES